MTTVKMPVPNTGNLRTDDAINNLSKTVERELDKRTRDDTTRGGIFLSSPDGSVWELKVDDAGALNTTKVFG